MNNLLRQNHIRRATEKYALLVPLISEMVISRWIPREMSQYHCGSIPIVFQVSPIMYAKYQLSVGYIPDCMITVSSLYGAMTYVCLWFPMGIFQKKIERWFPHVSYYWVVYWCWFHLTLKWSLGTSLVSLVSQFHYIAQYLLSVVPHSFSW